MTLFGRLFGGRKSPREDASKLKFSYSGEFNGRTEWGKIEASSKEEALASLQAKGIIVRRLSQEAYKEPSAKEVVGALVGSDALECDETYQRSLKIMDNWETIQRMDPNHISNDPKAQRLLKGMSQLPYPDIVARAKRLL